MNTLDRLQQGSLSHWLNSLLDISALISKWNTSSLSEAPEDGGINHPCAVSSSIYALVIAANIKQSTLPIHFKVS